MKPCATRARAVTPAIALVLFAALGCGAASSAPAAVAQAPGASAKPATTAFVSPYSYEWFVRAELLAARGDYRAAADAYRAALSSTDDDPYLLARLADALERAGETDAAERALASALEIDPRSEAAWLERGEIAERHAAFDAAIAAYERALDAAPESPAPVFALARALRAHGNPERAVALLENFAAHGERGGRAALDAQIELARARGDGAALAEATRQLIARGGAGAERSNALAAELFAHDEAVLAVRVLTSIPEASRDHKLELSVELALMRRAEVELLLATTPPSELGGPLEIAEAYLRIGLARRALVTLEETDGRDDPNRHALLLGLALLDTGEAARAALELAKIPRESAHHERAARALAQALEAAGLPALGRETVRKP